MTEFYLVSEKFDPELTVQENNVSIFNNYDEAFDYARPYQVITKVNVIEQNVVLKMLRQTYPYVPPENLEASDNE